GFLRIQFPQIENIELKELNINKKEIYPENKSHLEVLLDQFFLIESYKERFDNLSKTYDGTINISNSNIIDSINSYFIDGILPPVINSWDFENRKIWLSEPIEKFDGINNIVSSKLILPNLNHPQ